MVNGFSKMGWLDSLVLKKLKSFAMVDNSELVKVTSKYCSNQYLRIGYFVVKEKTS